MAGIYLHIPFCKQACTYCNFHFTTSHRYTAEMVFAIGMEAKMESSYLQRDPVHTIYFGGGTPSILDTKELKFLLDTLHQHYPVSGGAEITLETNPDDITPDLLKEWRALGFNRLSIGIQSFFEEELRWMNRAHTAQMASNSLQLAKEVFDNLTVDLIYGSPMLTDEMWKANVDRVVGLGIPHLSCYALTVEEKTPLHKKIRSDQSPDVDNDQQARQFLLLMQWLRDKGYEHYEVSNFALPGFRSKHNSSYWKGESYLGLGPSAHSFNGTERRWNIANNQRYIDSVKSGSVSREAEVLTRQQQLNEYVMISLRTIEGIDLNRIESVFGSPERKRIEMKIGRYDNTGLLYLDASQVVLTEEGMLRADGIACELFT